MVPVAIAKCQQFIATTFYSFPTEAAICIQEVVDRNISFLHMLRYEIEENQIPAHVTMSNALNKTLIMVSQYRERIDFFEINEQKKVVHLFENVMAIEQSLICSIVVHPTDPSIFLVAGKQMIKAIKYKLEI